MRALTLLSLPVFLVACLPDGSGPSGDATSPPADAAPDTPSSDAPSLIPCIDDYDCPRLSICADSACRIVRCSLTTATCGEGRGCHLGEGLCSVVECSSAVACWPREDADEACLLGVCQPPR